eukprot:TRINITY_DN3161_c1_g1_i1.p1 TRINITY_DN3161_c1_g1~~TRINITY_DN3161_c1_g1_i1.p1  ORF type:complete len:396 (+),score=43.22 TRINITY_DN3161_c1_g1_i1:43-1230(+)
MQSIFDLAQATLPAPANNVFRVTRGHGECLVDPELTPRALDFFRSRPDEPDDTALARGKRQEIVTVTNPWACESTSFNHTRVVYTQGRVALGAPRNFADYMEETKRNCDFCDPLRYTVEDVFGRLENEHCVTCSNIAKYTPLHANVIFRQHDPVGLSPAQIRSGIDLAGDWFAACLAHARRTGVQATLWPVIGWNCLGRAGASVPHGHFHVQLLATPPPFLMRIAAACTAYSAAGHGEAYIADWVSAHKSLGLDLPLKPSDEPWDSVTAFAHLIPVKAKELCVVDSAPPAGVGFSDRFKTAFGHCLTSLLRSGTTSFNAAIYLPTVAGTLSGTQQDIHELLFDHPDKRCTISRIVDRLQWTAPGCDVGAMELFECGSPCVSDPFVLTAELRPSEC